MRPGHSEEGAQEPCPAHPSLVLKYKSQLPPATCHHFPLLQRFSQDEPPVQPLKMAFVPAPGYQPTYNPVRY